MDRPAVGESGMSRLDVAKMVVEDLTRQVRKRRNEHLSASSSNVRWQRSAANLGQQGNVPDQFLLLSTSRQYPDSTEACGANGRLLVGYAGTNSDSSTTLEIPSEMAQHTLMEKFQRELKGLRAAEWTPQSNSPFPEGAGGAAGLNSALSWGLQLLSRYRLQNPVTENFGMGRVPNGSLVMPNGGHAIGALQSACLVLITDGACLRQHPKLGGGSLELQLGSQPLREFYREPFRWDQRIFCLGVGAKKDVLSSRYLHPRLRALCEVTGGSHWMVQNSELLQRVTSHLMQQIAPQIPSRVPLQDPLYLRLHQAHDIDVPERIPTVPGSSFVNAGPVCCFQTLEQENPTKEAMKRRAMLLYVGSPATVLKPTGSETVISPPLWFLPENFFPSKKTDLLPPRMAQPLLHISTCPGALGSKSFEPQVVIKLLHRLDQQIQTNRQLTGQQVKLLHRDVYICEWLSEEGKFEPATVTIGSRQEYFPVMCRGAGRPSLGDDAAESFLNVGILRVPYQSSTLANGASCSRLATLTLMPPEPHILFPLLLRVADTEHRAIKKAIASLEKAGAAPSNAVRKQVASKVNFSIDDKWKSEFRAYLFRLPPYYQFAMKRCFNTILPGAVQALLPSDTAETVMNQCLSKSTLQKLRHGVQVQKEANARLDKQEGSLVIAVAPELSRVLRHGQFDPRSSKESFLSALRTMPPPKSLKRSTQEKEANACTLSSFELVGDLPASCMMAYYESRRRWLFGGPSLSTRGLHAEGINNGGSNYQKRGQNSGDADDSLLAMAGVGVSSFNRTSTANMGDYRERLVFSKSPIVGLGSNDYGGVAATTAIDGSPVWSVDDDAMPIAFFNPKTGEFSDSSQVRLRSRLMVNFGNPYKEKRADSIIPEEFASQAPSTQRATAQLGDPLTPPGSPPHDYDSSFDSVEEGEAAFVRKSPSRVSPQREDDIPPPPPSPPKKQRVDGEVPTAAVGPSPNRGVPPRPRPPPPQPMKRQKSVETSPGAPQVAGARPPPPRPPTATGGKQPPPPPRHVSKPANQEQTSQVAATAQPGVPGHSEINLQQADKKPDITLAPHWMCVWSKSQKRWYFFDTKTNTSVWQWPPPR